MNNAYLAGYQKKDIRTLLRAIDDCTSLSQLFALIQHEQIEIHMHAQSGASNIQPKTLNTQDIIKNRDLPLDRLKQEVKKAVCLSYVPPQTKTADSQLIRDIRATKTLSELFALIQREHIVIQMHAQSGASNLTPKKLPQKPLDSNESPFDRFKAEVIKAVAEQQE